MEIWAHLKTFKPGRVKKARENLLLLEDLPIVSGTVPSFHLRKNTFCNWKLHTKVSAESKFARTQSIFNFVGCPLVQTKSEHIQRSPIFFKFDCSWPWLVQGHLKLSNWDKSKESWPANGGTCQIERNFCNWQLHTKVSAESKFALRCKRNLNTFK